MQDILDLDRYPLDQPDVRAMTRLVAECREGLAADGMFTLDGFLRAGAIAQAVGELAPLIETSSFRHARRHNIYFKDRVPGAAADHPALARFETVNHTLCADQLAGTLIDEIYGWAPLVSFLARAMDKPRLFLMDDPLARVNVLAYGAGEALNWHFDRSQYTTTLLIRAADSGGEFEYRSALRSDDDPNFDGVARLLRGEDPEIRVNRLAAGSLNVFAGRNTAHRITPVQGVRSRIIAVLSYYETPGVTFSDAERIGFYGRAG